MNDIVMTGTGLLMAHVLTDFILQTSGMIRSKRSYGWRSIGLLAHALSAGFLALLLTWDWENWLVIGGITCLSHWLIDLIKVHIHSTHSLKAFLVDQLAHVAVIAALLFYLYPQLAVLFFLYQDSVIVMAVYLLGLILIFRPAGFLVEHAVKRWSDIAIDSGETLPEAGKLIGYLERLLIFLFMMLNQYAAIGFLIAAKSILRFRDQPGQHRLTEYILLGTLLSFTTAIIISLAVKYAAGLVKP